MMDIELTIKNYRCFSDANPARLKMIFGFTAFLGINNAGKSSLLKFFYEFRELFRTIASTTIVVLGQGNSQTPLTLTLNDTQQSFSFPPEVTDPEEVFCNANQRNIVIQIRLLPTSELINVAPHMMPKLEIVVKRGSSLWISKMSIDSHAVEPGNLSFRGENHLYKGNESIADLSYLLRACEILGNTFYIGAFRNTINLGSEGRYYDISVGQAFISQWSGWKTGPMKRYQEIAYQVQEDIAKIFEYSKLEINASPDGQRLHMIINGKSYKASELGSGLTQFFLVLACAAMRHQPPAFILIDEPEINLHPSLQLDFLTRLTSYASQGVFFATHSIGLARSSADYIYSVHRSIDNLSEVTEYDRTPRLAELLGELSFAGYKELGFDKILLVEGATEVKTIQQFLRWYKKEHQIVLLPMGGDQMINPDAETQLEEIRRISDNVFALIDSELPSEDAELEAKRVAFKKRCDDANIPCHVLKRRAIENYFPDYAIKKAKGSAYRALGPYEAFKPPFPRWAKSENWQIAREMNPEDVDKTDLGEFLKSL